MFKDSGVLYKSCFSRKSHCTDLHAGPDFVYGFWSINSLMFKQISTYDLSNAAGFQLFSDGAAWGSKRGFLKLNLWVKGSPGL